MSARQRDSQATRNALLEATAELTSRHGFDGTTIERIARRAGVNKAMISYHFGGKKGVYSAVLEDIVSTLSSRLEAVRAWDAPADQRLAAFIAAFRDMVRGRPAAPLIMIREAISGGRHLDQKIFPGFLRIFTVLQEILEQGVGEGRFRPVNPVLTQVGLVGSLMFFFATESFRSRLVQVLEVEAGKMGPDDYIRHWREMMLGGLAVRPQGNVSRPIETEAGPPGLSGRAVPPGRTEGDDA